jgi:hypothetical protein
MSLEEHITKMTIAIRQAIKVMGARFSSTEQDVARAIQELKSSIQLEPGLSVKTLPLSGTPSPQNKGVTVGE